MSQRVRIPDTVYERAEELQEEYDYPTLGEAIRQVFREAGYDV